MQLLNILIFLPDTSIFKPQATARISFYIKCILLILATLSTKINQGIDLCAAHRFRVGLKPRIESLAKTTVWFGKT